VASRGAIAAEVPESQFRIYTWKTEQGLPQNSVKMIHQSQDGYLWFGTRFGIVRFDAVSFHVFNRVNTEALPYDNCLGIAEEENGLLWFALPNGAVSYQHGEFTHHKLCGGMDDDKVSAICASAGGGIWLATAGGLLRYQNRTVTRYTYLDGLRTNSLSAVLEDADRTLWIGGAEGLQRRDPVSGRFSDAWAPDNTPDKLVRCIFKDHAGNLWIGTKAAGVHRWKHGRWTGFTDRDGLTDIRVEFITEDHDGTIWAGTGKGELLRFRDGRFAPFGRNEGLSADTVLCAQEDREGNLWVGTDFGGLKRMQPRRILAYSTREGLTNCNVWSICESRQGGLWVGTDGGFSRFKDGRFNNYSLGKNVAKPIVRSIFEDRSGTVWIGTTDDGLRRLRDGKLTSFSTADGLTYPQIKAIYEDREGALWIGTMRGLNRLKDGVLTTYTVKDGLSSGEVRAIYQDRSGVHWIGTYGGGLNRLENGRFRVFTMSEGLSDNFAWCIREDKEGALWIGTENGLNRLKNGCLTSITTRQGLFDNVINDLLEDRQGNMWIGCNRGIYRVSKADLDAVADGTKAAVEYVSYGISDGMLSSETNGEIQPAACKTSDGRLWFPTTDGVVMIDPDKITLNDLAPPVVIEEVLMDQLPLKVNEPARLEPGRGNVLEVHYTANSLVAPEKVRFKYCLVGWKDKWVEADTRRVAYYTNLRPGHYTFRVTGSNNHGIWSDRGASFTFYLKPHFYQTWPFYLLCGLCVILLGYGLHRIRLSVVREIERLEKLHALEKERARIANEMHDDLGASLTQIALLGELASRDLSNTDRVGEHIQNILSTARGVFRGMDEIVWAVNPRHDTLSSLIDYLSKYAQDFLRPAGIRCRLDMPTDVPAYPLTSDARHNIFLTVKEALNNIVKHAGATEVWLRVGLDATRCTISVEDNGRGFQVGSTRPGGNGLSNMKERLEAIGGELRLASRTGGGTALELIIQLSHVQPIEPN